MSKLDEIVKKNIGAVTPNLREDTLKAIDETIEAIKEEICNKCTEDFNRVEALENRPAVPVEVCWEAGGCEQLKDLDLAFKALKEVK